MLIRPLPRHALIPMSTPGCVHGWGGRPPHPPRRRHAHRPARRPAVARRQPRKAAPWSATAPRRRRSRRPTPPWPWWTAAWCVPAGDGETTITATLDGKQATVKVKVRPHEGPFDLEFSQSRYPDVDARRLQLRAVPRRPRRQGRAETVAARLRSGCRSFRADAASARPPR